MCDSTVTVNLTVLPALTGSETSTICNNESVTVNGTVYDANNPSGTEVISNVGPFMCDSTVTVNLTVLPAIDTSVTVVNTTLTVGESGATYQWLDCNNGNEPIAGATSQTYEAVTNGDYAVQVTVGMCSETSACNNVTITGIDSEDATSGLEIYPNPTRGSFTLSIPDLKTASRLVVYSVLGKEIMNEVITNTITLVDIKGVENGIYFVRIQHGNKSITRRVVKY